MQSNVIPAPEAARRKDCSRQTIYNALSRGDLSEISYGSTRLVLLDEKWKEWMPANRGGRALGDQHQSPEA
jgi:hypothetical protein